jgi:hypothetical protein
MLIAAELGASHQLGTIPLPVQTDRDILEVGRVAVFAQDAFHPPFYVGSGRHPVGPVPGDVLSNVFDQLNNAQGWLAYEVAGVLVLPSRAAKRASLTDGIVADRQWQAQRNWPAENVEIPRRTEALMAQKPPVQPGGIADPMQEDETSDLDTKK